LSTSKSYADFMQSGPPPEGGSWSVVFTNNSGLDFTFMIIDMVSGWSLESPGISALSTSGWGTNFLGSFAVAADLSLGFNSWNDGEVTFNFAGDQTAPASFVISGIDAGFNILDSTLVEWNGSSYSYSPSDAELPSGWQEAMAGLMVPLPPAV